MSSARSSYLIDIRVRRAAPLDSRAGSDDHPSRSPLEVPFEGDPDSWLSRHTDCFAFRIILYDQKDLRSPHLFFCIVLDC